MELGVVLPHTGSWASPAMVRSVALGAEAAGLDALWTIDHIVAPFHTESPYVLGRTPEESGQAAWVGALQGGASRALVAHLILTSREGFDRALAGYYSSALFRAPDPTGAAVWWAGCTPAVGAHGGSTRGTTPYVQERCSTARGRRVSATSWYWRRLPALCPGFGRFCLAFRPIFRAP